MELAELHAGFDADFVNEPVARGEKRLKRLGLAATLVERPHAQGVQAFPQRVRVDEPFQFRQCLFVATSNDVTLNREFLYAQPQLIKPADLDRGERFAGHVGQRFAVPQRQGVADGGICGPGSVGFLHQVQEARRVNGVGANAQLVAASVGHDPRIVVREETPNP